MRLPAALAPWHAWLQWLQPDQQLALGAVLLRLDPLLGDFRGRSPAGEPEPVGIDDLRRRGPYHRLVLSEWALSDELPDEFLRRAAQGEHLFLSPRLEARHGDALNIVVFDAGPAQLGRARLVHVALWILLARRAARARIPFAWGVLQRPGELAAADSPQQLKDLLEARTLERATDAHRIAWQEHFAKPELAPGERWLVSAPGARPPGFSHHATVRRGFDEPLAVVLSSAHARRAVELEPPADAASSRLLRGRFGGEPESPATKPARRFKGKLALLQPPVFGPGAVSIAVPLLDEHALAIFHPPGQHQRKKSITKLQWPQHIGLAAVAGDGWTFGGVWINGVAHVGFWHVDGFGGANLGAHRFTAVPGQAHWLPATWCRRGEETISFCVLDKAGTLHNFSRRKGQLGVIAADGGVLAIGHCDRGTLTLPYVRHIESRVELVVRHAIVGATHVAASTPLARDSTPTRAFLNGAAHGPTGWAGAWCVASGRASPDGPLDWQLCVLVPGATVPAVETIEVRPGWKVIGVVKDTSVGRHALVALPPNRGSVVALTADGGQRTLFTTPRPIASASVAADADVVALVTEARELVVLRVDADAGAWTAWSVAGDE